MKVYLVVKDKIKNTNYFSDELASILRKAGHEIITGLDFLWCDDVFQCDIIYFQWPEYIYPQNVTKRQIDLLQNRIKEIKRKGIKIFAHCHNLKPHILDKSNILDIYDVVYGNCDAMIHMGIYSQLVMQKEYPSVMHYIIPHPIYESFNFNLDSTDCKKKLKLPIEKINILCFGQFRTQEERNFILSLKRRLPSSKFHFVTPGFYRERYNQHNMIKTFLVCFWTLYYFLKGMRFSHNLIDDRATELYFAASDLVLIQRPVILNSGNLPMAFAAGKIVVGPDVGNVGPILKETHNPTFNPNDLNSAINAIMQALNIKNKCGENNLRYAQEHWSHEPIGKLFNNLLLQLK